MSLKVWLPLNGTLDNQGLDDIVVTNNGATISDDGKIGKCYSFNGNTSYIAVDGDFLNDLRVNSQHTFAFWFYNNDVGERSIFFATVCTSGYGISIQKTTDERLRVYWQASPDWNIPLSTYTILSETWTHITMTIKNGNCVIYINGDKVVENTTGGFTASKLTNIWAHLYLGRDSRTGTTAFAGKINDFRWYDHALSPMEVKQISQGLILHYLLNHNGFGNDNLSTDTLVEKNLYKNASNTYFSPVNIYPLSEDARSIILNSQVGDLVTYSFDYEIENNEVENYQMRAVLKTSGSSFSQSGLQYVYSKGGILPLGNSSGHAEATFKLKQAHKTYGTGWLITAHSSNQNIKAKITHFKFEIGGKATPWCPNPTEIPTDSIFGYNDDIEYDCSGYKNNGAKEGVFNYILDTPKYNVSTMFNGSNYIEAESLPDETKTISVWVNYQTLPTGSDYSGFIMFDKNTQISICVYSGGQYLIPYIGSSKGGTGSRVITSFQTNKWYHIVVLKTGATTREVYINGIKATPSGTNYWSGDLNKLLIGTRHAAGVYKDGANAKICDFRAYTTLLSPQDILSLYNNEAYIDNNGNIYGAVYEEG